MLDVIVHAPTRNLDAASARASIESGGRQFVGPQMILGDAVASDTSAAFADDTAPSDALVAVRGADGWVVGETLHEARQRAGKVQGRRTTLESVPPLDPPPGAWPITLRTSWVEPAYLETDASWCLPGGTPTDPLANGGAFGGKTNSDVAAVARGLADQHGRAVRVLWSREDTVRYGPKRPPIAAGLDAEGCGVIRIARTPGVVEVLRTRLPDCEIEEVDLVGPPTSLALRAAGWAEAEMLRAAVAGSAGWVTGPSGGMARADVTSDGIVVEVDAGDPLDEVMLRSYAIGAAHMAWSWVTSESLVVDAYGEVHDLTVRSFGVVRSSDMPNVVVSIGGSGPAVGGGDAVFAAVAAATWLAAGRPAALPAAFPLRGP